MTWFPNSLGNLNSIMGSEPDFSGLKSREKAIATVGEPGTMKSRIGYAFLAAAFQNGQQKTATILLTNEAMKMPDLRTAISEWDGVKLPSEESNRILIREIRPRFISSSDFVYRLRACIRFAKIRVLEESGENYNIRVLIDNWSSIIESHATLKDEPQLLLAVMSILREEGVLAMIVSTQPGSLGYSPTLHRVHDVSQLEIARIHCLSLIHI